MPTRSEPWPHGTPCWVDLSVPDVAAAVEFYGALLGWTAVDSGEEMGHYHICSVGDRAAAGIGPIMQEGQPSAWTVYLASDDADATVKAIGEAGGAVLVPPMEIPGNGRMMIAQDPAGAVFGVWEARGMVGIAVYNEPGGLLWEDARLSDPDAGRAFYSSVFGHRYEPVEGAPAGYTIFHTDGHPLGGMGGLDGMPDGIPSHWLPYFAVADADAAIATATAAGAQVVAGPEDTPWGRMACLTDPQGAVFMVMTSSPEAAEAAGAG
ncbi:MAG: VOC family protein [Pseudonocardia sp.]